MTIIIENDLFNYSIMKTLQVKIHRENSFSNVFYNRGKACSTNLLNGHSYKTKITSPHWSGGRKKNPLWTPGMWYTSIPPKDLDLLLKCPIAHALSE